MTVDFRARTYKTIGGVKYYSATTISYSAPGVGVSGRTHTLVATAGADGVLIEMLYPALKWADVARGGSDTYVWSETVMTDGVPTLTVDGIACVGHVAGGVRYGLYAPNLPVLASNYPPDLSGRLSLDQISPQTISGGQPIQDSLTASQIVATDASKKLQTLAVASYPNLTELSRVKGVTSAIQTQIDNRLKLDQTSAQTITNGQPIQDTLTASQIVATDANKKLQSLAVATYPSLTELSYVKGVTSAVQTQIGVLQKRSFLLSGDFRGLYSCSTAWLLADLTSSASVYPNGLTITSWYLRCSTASPTTQINADLKYCDTGTAFPGANVTTLATLDSTSGAASATGLTTNVPAAKLMYVQFDADPTDYQTTWRLVVNVTVL